MESPSSDLPVASTGEALSQHRQPVLPPTLQPVTCDDFLPEPGPWASALGRQLLLLLSVGALALAIWPMRETVTAPGIVRPTGENTLVQSEQGGTVQRVLLRQNQSVHAGQLLAVFDRRPLQAERRQLEVELSALQAQAQQARNEQASLDTQASALERLSTSLTQSSLRGVEQAKAALAFDRNELRRYRSLQSSGAVPRSLVEEKQARQLVSQSEVLKALQGVTEQRARGLSELARLRQSSSQARSSADELRKQVAQRRARLQQVDRALELATVRAPISGSVLSTNLRHPGQVMQPGELVAVLAPGKSQYELKLQVPAERISQLRPGQKATLKVSACPTAEFGVLPARVTSVSADIIPQSGEPSGTTAAVYEAVLHPLQTTLRGRQGSCTLRPGMKLTGDIVTRRTTVLMFLLNKLRLGT